MKAILFVFVIVSILLSSCSGGYSQTSTLIEWPVVCEISTGECFSVVTAEKPAPSERVFPQYVKELIPLPEPSPEETAAVLAEFGIDPSEQIMFAMLPSSWINEDDGSLVMASAVLTNPDPNMCKALIGHLIYRVTQDGATWAQVTSMLTAFGNGEIVPNVIKSGKNGAKAIQFVWEGVKWLFLFGNSSTPPTIIGPVIGNTLGRLAGNLNNLVVGQGQAVSVMAEAVAIVKCVRDNWPKNSGDSEQVRRKHNETYFQKHLDSIPADFPIPFPKSNGEEIMIQVHPGDFSNLTRASLNTLIVLGIVVLAVDTIPGDEVAASAAYLKWSLQLATP